MPISYSLRYQKSNLFHKIFIEKEGEAVLYDRGIRLKGKGANDKGELINFSDIKELSLRDESLSFNTFTKDFYTLSHAGTIFEEFMHDFFRFRNEFIIGALFLKQGDLIASFDGAFERTNPIGKIINKGTAKIRIYSDGIVVVPELNDAFLVPFAFLQMHDFDDDEYTFKTVLDSNITVVFSKLENDYEVFREKVETAMGLFYDKILREMRNYFTDFGPDLLVKLVKLMENGKAIKLKDIKKIDKDLAQKIMDTIMQDEILKQSLAPIMKEADDEHTYVGMLILNGKKDVLRFTIMFALPDKNLVSCTTGSYDADIKKINDTLFFKIIMERGNPEEKIEHKILEINQALILLNFALDPMYKDKREMRRSIYKMATRKLPFLRILRKSFVASLPTILPNIFLKNLDAVYQRARIVSEAMPTAQRPENDEE
ncbi:hypothetical protein HZA39_00165 [Candidatus Peregrinibacteria bacterium]|nr:hypothetical protein [Candidatus Peregrinibacteria bacterium]